MQSLLRTGLLAAIALAAPAAIAGSGPGRPLLAAARLRAVSPDGRVVAEVRPRLLGGEGVWAANRLVWPEPGVAGQTRVETGMVWSRRGDALAFAARDGHGGSSLVVVVVGDCRGGGCAAPATIMWPIPSSALPVRSVMWLGPGKVAAGPKELEPRVVASFQTQ